MLPMDEDPSASITTSDGLTAVKMQETSAVLALIIPLCYNLQGVDLQTVPHDLLFSAYRAANKFTCLRARDRFSHEFAMRYVG